MKINRYIPLLGILLGVLGFTACQDDFDNKIPAFEAPVAEHQANMSILDLKKMYWHEGTETTDLNYCETVGHHPDVEKYGEEGHIYISGRVISNDQEGNIFKSLVIQDESAALAISINQYDLYLQYRPGQEIVIDVTGMYIGKYRGLLQLGLPSYNENWGVTETSFMPIEFFRMHAEKNGFPEPSKIDTLAFNNFDEFSSSANPEILMKYQSQLVRFNNVSFVDANGTTKFSEYKSSGVNHYLTDMNGASNIMPVRTSGYASFWNNPLPQDKGDVVGILGYYASNANNASYQLMLNDLAGCMNFGNPTVPKGTSADNPYTIDDVIEMENADQAGSGWVTGYIVGAVKPEVNADEPITSSSDIEWTADVTLANTLVIAPAAEVTDISMCLVLPLPQNTPLRQYGNLVDNPSNYKKSIQVKGSFGKYLGAWGLTSAGAAADFRIDGVTVPGGDTPPAGDGDGTEAKPYTIQQALAIYAQGGTTDMVWIECYILGSVKDGSLTYDDVVFGTTDASQTNIVVGPSVAETNKANCMPVQLPSGAVRTALNLKTNPGNLGKKVILHGTIEKYFSTGGIKNVSEYKLEGGETPDNPPTPPTGGSGTGTESDPWDVAKVISLYTGAIGETGWLKAYIVGTVPTQYYTDAVFGVENASATNILVAASPNETNTANCVPVQLPTGDVRNALNLQANPGNLGKEVMLNGTIDKYFGQPGFKSVTAYKFDGSSTPDTPDNPPTPPTGGSGTEASPLSVTQMISLYVEGQATDCWVEGYIVGTCPKGTVASAEFGIATATNTNMILAPTPGETDMSKCIPVQLPSGDIRAALNLKDNPGNLGRHVKLHGSCEKYMTVAGLKSLTGYAFY